ncbi:hypothetical protein [Epibacterium ulvae]|uniref:hypothetical protein n=1 Tax=Epibacterium ulvae TaxID=1156985 RepID=UPI002492916C|nr:hypothetical protein [Epibacterium ulvae]
MIPDPYNETPLEYVLTEHIAQMVGIVSHDMLEVFLEVPEIQNDIAQIIKQQLPELEELDEITNSVEIFLLGLDQTGLEQMAKVVCILTQAQAIKSSLRGDYLRRVSDYCGSRDVVKYCFDKTVPSISTMNSFEELENDALDHYTLYLKACLLGLLPHSYVSHFTSRFPASTLKIDTLDSWDATDKDNFRALIEVAIAISPNLAKNHA